MPINNRESIPEHLIKIFEDDVARLAYRQEGVRLALMALILERMEERGISEAELAKQIKNGKSVIKRMMSGYKKFTWEEVVLVLDALDCELGVYYKYSPKLNGQD